METQLKSICYKPEPEGPTETVNRSYTSFEECKKYGQDSDPGVERTELWSESPDLAELCVKVHGWPTMF
jgi:hypothetical protein